MTFNTIAVSGFVTGVALTVLAVGIDLTAQHQRRNTAPLTVICESGNEYRDPARDTDPYYVETINCTLGNANGRAVHVVVID